MDSRIKIGFSGYLLIPTPKQTVEEECSSYEKGKGADRSLCIHLVPCLFMTSLGESLRQNIYIGAHVILIQHSLK